MRVRLNRSNIQRLEVRRQRYEVADEEIPPLRLRITPSGTKTFILLYRTRDAKQKRFTIGKFGQITPEQARKIAQNKLAEVQLGQDPQRDKQEARKTAQMPTLGEFIESRYLPWHRSHYRSKSIVSALRQFPGLEGKALDKVTTWDLEKWRKSRLDNGASHGTLNRYLEAIKALYNRAIEWSVIESNPVASLKRLREDDSAVVRYLDQDEDKRLREALRVRDEQKQQERRSANEWRRARGYDLLPEPAHYGDHLTPMVLLALNSGMRRGELFNLDWQDVNLPQTTLTVRGKGAKSSKTRFIPMNLEAVEILRNWKAQQQDVSGLVFPGKDGKRLDNIKKGWEALIAAAKIQKFRFHDLRHSFASKLVMAGVDLNTVRELLGHSDIKMTLRYAHLAPEHKAAAVAKLVEVRNG